MSQNLMLPNFASGEISPALYARSDLSKYHSALALMNNFFVDYRGGAVSSPGSLFIGHPLNDSYPTKLVDFQFSTIQAYILEFGHNYMRVILNGGYALETAKNVTAASGLTFTVTGHGFSNGDWVFLNGVTLTGGVLAAANSSLYIVTVIDANTISLTSISGANPPGVTGYLSGGQVARVYTLATPWAGNDVPNIKYTQSADVLTITVPGYPPYDIGRTGDTAWTINQVTFSSSINPPASVTATFSGTGTGSTAEFGYVVTAVSQSGEESIASPAGKVNCPNIGVVSGAITITWAAVPSAAYYNIYKASPATGLTDLPAGVQFGYIGQAFGTSFVDSNITSAFTRCPPRHVDPFAPGQVLYITVTNGGSGYAAGTTASLTDSTGSGAILQPIIVGGVIVAFLVTNGGKLYSSPTIVLGSTGGGTGFAGTIKLGAASGTYPTATTYFQQRKLFAASTGAPTTLWGSKPGNFQNFDSGIPINDGDSYIFSLASQQVNAITALVALAEGLLIFTSGGVWQLTSGSSVTNAVTPTNAATKIQSYEGAKPLPPIVIGHNVLYVQDPGSIVKNMAYNFYAGVYTGEDITVLSNHLFVGHSLLAWTYAKEPNKLIYCVRDDGVMLVLTHLQEQQVEGWSRRTTQGIYTDVRSIQEGNENAVYYTCKRWINGTFRTCIERFVSRNWAGPDDYWCVDAGAAYKPVAQTISLLPSAISGSGVTFTAASGIFSAGSVGKVIRISGGVATITAYVSPTQVTGTFTYPITDYIDNVNGSPIPKPSTSWTLGTPATVISGLNHLNGLTVSILADGSVITPQTVVNGSITLQTPASYVIVGLGYRCQLKTLPLDAGEPTIQGKRKEVKAITVRCEVTRGLKGGSTFGSLTEMKWPSSTPSISLPPPGITGDQRYIMDNRWDSLAGICIEQDYPLPAKVLGLIPEIVVGDS